MATVLLSLSPGKGEFQVTQAVGSATVSGNIELTVDVATNLVNTASGTRGLAKSEILEALEKLKNHIIKSTSFPG